MNRIQRPSAPRNPLNEDRPDSAAKQDATRRGLVLIPGTRGMYADPKNPRKAVARTIKGKLHLINPDKKPQPQKNQPKSSDPQKKPPVQQKQPPQKERPVAASPNISNRTQLEKEIDAAEKNKTLQNIDTARTEVFTQSLSEPLEVFKERSAKYRVLNDPYTFSKNLRQKIVSSGKVPVNVVEFLERGIGVRSVAGVTEAGKFFAGSDSVGMGGSASNMGEIMTMIATTLSDKDAEEFFNELDTINGIAQKRAGKSGKLVVTRNWIQAAEENRFANLAQLKARYGNDFEIVATAWDVSEQVEALGLRDVADNKEDSTDIFFKVRTKEGMKLEEISLKQNIGDRIHNTGVEKLLIGADPSLKGTEYDPRVYGNELRTRLKVAGHRWKKELLQEAESGQNKALASVLTTKKFSLDRFSDILERGPRNTNESKVIKFALMAAGEHSDEIAKYHDDHEAAGNDYIKKAVDKMVSSEAIKKEIVNLLRENMPLKGIAEGRERMSAGKFTIDDRIFRQIYGTNDWNAVQEHLVIQTDKNDRPFLGYYSEYENKILPLAKIVVRENQKGYGTVIRFDLSFAKEFIKEIKDANATTYLKNGGPNVRARRDRLKQKAAEKASLSQTEVVEIIREELKAYLKRKSLDMSDSKYKEMVRSMIHEAPEGTGAFGKSAGGLQRPADDKPKKKKPEESPFDRVRSAQRGRNSGQTTAQQAAQGAAAGTAAAGGAPGADGAEQPTGDEPNKKEKEMTKDLHKLNRADNPPDAESALSKATLQYYKAQGNTKYPSQNTMKILDSQKARIMSYAQKAFQAYGYAKGLRKLEGRLRDLYKVDDKDVMNVASAVAHLLKKDNPPESDPLVRSRGHHRQYNPFRGY